MRSPGAVLWRQSLQAWQVSLQAWMGRLRSREMREPADVASSLRRLWGCLRSSRARNGDVSARRVRLHLRDRVRRVPRPVLCRDVLSNHAVRRLRWDTGWLLLHDVGRRRGHMRRWPDRLLALADVQRHRGLSGWFVLRTEYQLRGQPLLPGLPKCLAAPMLLSTSTTTRRRHWKDDNHGWTTVR